MVTCLSGRLSHISFFLKYLYNLKNLSEIFKIHYFKDLFWHFGFNIIIFKLVSEEKILFIQEGFYHFLSEPVAYLKT